MTTRCETPRRWRRVRKCTVLSLLSSLLTEPLTHREDMTRIRRAMTSRQLLPELPPEIWTHVLSFLSARDLACAQRVSLYTPPCLLRTETEKVPCLRTWNNIASQKALWQSVFNRQIIYIKLFAVRMSWVEGEKGFFHPPGDYPAGSCEDKYAIKYGSVVACPLSWTVSRLIHEFDVNPPHTVSEYAIFNGMED